jgi:molybdopterin converting factor small subunit
MITVRLPSMLRGAGAAEFTISRPVETLGALIDVLDAMHPGLARKLDDTLYNFAVNDAMVLHGVGRHPLKPGDTVEVIPTISGG